jgi:hypothetical protein
MCDDIVNLEVFDEGMVETGAARFCCFLTMSRG